MLDSLPIAMHLDKVFPSPPLFPSGDARYALLVAVGKIASLLEPGFRPLIVPRVADHLDPRGQKYFHETRSAALGKPLSEVRPTDKESLDKLWKLVETESAALIKMLKGTEGKKGPFFEGEEPGFADFRMLANWRLSSALIRSSLRSSWVWAMVKSRLCTRLACPGWRARARTRSGRFPRLPHQV